MCAVVAASALSASSSTAATAERSALLEELEDPTLLAALRGSRSETAEAEDDGPKVGTALSGELVPAPLGAVGLVLPRLKVEQLCLLKPGSC